MAAADIEQKFVMLIRPFPPRVWFRTIERNPELE